MFCVGLGVGVQAHTTPSRTHSPTLLVTTQTTSRCGSRRSCTPSRTSLTWVTSSGTRYVHIVVRISMRVSERQCVALPEGQCWQWGWLALSPWRAML